MQSLPKMRYKSIILIRHNVTSQIFYMAIVTCEFMVKHSVYVCLILMKSIFVKIVKHLNSWGRNSINYRKKSELKIACWADNPNVQK